MIDLHTHILPAVDDGARDPEMSLALLREERDQGVDTVVLTPHFYRHRENAEDFLRRRSAAYDRLLERLEELPEDERATLPKMVLGCEVAWVPNLAELDCLPQLCIGETKNLLLELPFTPWSDMLNRQIYDLMGRTGITPVLAHLERYVKIQRRERVEEILSLGVAVQISADTFLSPFTRRESLRALQQWAHVVASDCHNTTSRRPRKGEAMKVIEKKLGPEFRAAVERRERHLLANG